jgi:mono/diheme cytochrome c family protein
MFMATMSRTSWGLVAVSGLFGLTVLSAEQAPSARGASAPPASPLRPAGAAASAPPPGRALLDRYCVTCHNEKLKTAGLVLSAVDVGQVAGNAEVLEKVAHKLRSGQMPPEGRPRPDKATADAFAAALETSLDRHAAAAPNPGRVAVHRLNRVTYVNAIRDLLALDIDPALLPVDNGGVGFDNNADVLSVTPALMNRYMSAATKVSRLAVGDATIRPATQVYRASEWATQTARTSEDLPFGTRGGFAVRHTFPLDGQYEFKVRLKRNFFGGTIHGIDDEHEIEVRVDGQVVQRYRVGGKYKGADPGILIAIPEDEVEAQKLHAYHLDADKDFNFRIPLKAGQRLVTAAFADNLPSVSEMVPLQPRSLKSANFDDASAPAIGTIEVSGPHEAKTPEDTASRRKIFVCRPASAREDAACARTILGSLARRAYRRPVTDADLGELLRLYALGRRDGDFDVGIGRALEGLLTMPAFLFRIEQDPSGARPGAVYRINDLELASRLSFFLWKSIPDDELLDAAVRRRLKTPAVLEAQVRRMLADPKATRWMNDFVAQWLMVRNLQAQEPDPGIFPEFDDNLREAMLKETELFFESQVRSDRSLLDLLGADYTYLNERLAQHYRVPNVYGGHFRRVPVTDPARQGLLGHASVLTVTSYAHRTSVVLRGKWVLETLLGAPPPPPPPNVPPLQENDGTKAPASLRERMENHRKNPVCATCHTRMDPMGFALENFDGTGKWRDTDAGAPIDPVISLGDGVKVDSPKAFRELLLHRGDEYIRTVIEKLLSYATGRSLMYYDYPTVRRLAREAEADGYRWTSVILGIVTSEPFQMRRVSGVDSTAAPANRVARSDRP